MSLFMFFLLFLHFFQKYLLFLIWISTENMTISQKHKFQLQWITWKPKCLLSTNHFQQFQFWLLVFQLDVLRESDFEGVENGQVYSNCLQLNKWKSSFSERWDLKPWTTSNNCIFFHSDWLCCDCERCWGVIVAFIATNKLDPSSHPTIDASVTYTLIDLNFYTFARSCAHHSVIIRLCEKKTMTWIYLHENAISIAKCMSVCSVLCCTVFT